MSASSREPAVRIGCAGWSLPKAAQPGFGEGNSHLERYATRLSLVEINSSFHRPHRREVYQRWAGQVPEGFVFAVKLPRTVTHDKRLADCESELDAFMAQANGLGPAFAAVLVQLPPSLRFDANIATGFLAALRARFEGRIALEPRHASWFEATADELLRAREVARVLADPVRFDAGRVPGGRPDWIYLRLHGSPRTYYSSYEPALIEALALRIEMAVAEGRTAWCVFDNTAAGAAAPNALSLAAALSKE